ncbi:MAG: PLP-dependent lyase/thiolase [Candidatus Berkelbacteria bacterium]|nr:PLP-dependent lyase/thiolase [Candidatus Berkelbacteria bacterium]MCR4307320.1 PLP-dependent lyase/thiolase [Candidatus Berkelbacteria bacterium]
MFFSASKDKPSNLTSEEEAILRSIVVASENNPNHPEFPPGNPRFPATPTYKIVVPGFTNVWLKDESVNPTGTHKDRLAWEIIVTYKYFIEAKKRGQTTGALPHMSIISSGSAAMAVQSMLRRYRLPDLKVLVDIHIGSDTVAGLRQIGCEIHRADLSRRLLSWKDILKLTFNRNGFDITSSVALDPTTRFYDWLSYEIINTNPSFCFIPFGTGNLYENVLNVAKKEISSRSGYDPRFKGDIRLLSECNFMGATTNNPSSKLAEKLYAPHLPFADYNEQWIRLYRQAGYCGPLSDVRVVKELFVDEAMKLAANQGINCEPSATAGLALMLQLKDSLPRDKKMLIVNTGKSHLPK